MKFVLVIHEVEDFARWKIFFDLAENLRKKAGEKTYQILKFEKQETKVVHFSQWSSFDAARNFFESAEVIQIRKEAGVKTPEFFYLESLEEGIL
ncbi:antibiotic biosynthesis monooxygenase [Leptospira ognonensis]|uniref:Antibiotic biosynthesis monooxygenase n=1 Tax=Leptospira ognonensis TaxID=2484945 RepID=A0A4V3JQP1_9LEPT|nr:antibiotic biosynthesis monooxygenase [Leptospira ognonensis]TGL56505.1 antibiotic biosynthesis monooxygenase [Leptospira ognonensis]